MKFKKIIREVYYCPEIILKELGWKFIPIFICLMICIIFIWFFVFEWIGINVAFSLPLIVLHYYSFIYFGLYKQLLKQLEKNEN